MALIPTDAALRLRLEAESQLLQPLQRVLDIPSELPELRPGQLFSARIQDALPDNTFRALVAGKSLTLSLPEGAKAGDTLELVVIDRSPKVLVARLAEPQAGEAKTEPYSFATLSRTGQLIGNLLPAEGEVPAPLPLAKGSPLLPAPPVDAGVIVPVLAKAVRQSGLFYEAHQAQWVAGQLPLADLLQEPQAGHSNVAQLLASSADPATEQVAWSLLQKSTPAPRGAQEAPDFSARGFLAGLSDEAFPQSARQGMGAAPDTAPGGPPSELTRSAAKAELIPEDLRPVVQNQLEAASNQRMAWHGEIWPRQNLSWEIDWRDRGGQGTSEEEREWRTTLSLTTPRLGDIQARISLGPAGVAVTILAPQPGTATDLRNAAPSLESALAAAGVPLTGLQIRDDHQPL